MDWHHDRDDDDVTTVWTHSGPMSARSIRPIVNMGEDFTTSLPAKIFNDTRDRMLNEHIDLLNTVEPKPKTRCLNSNYV